MPNVQTVISLLSEIAPHQLAYDWDNVGLQVGDYQQEVNRVLLTLDLTDQVIDEALAKNCEMVISHHPLIFKGLKSIHNQSETGKMIIKAIRNNLILYSAHSNLDIVPEGLNDFLAELLLIKETEPLQEAVSLKMIKLVVFVPEEDLEAVKKAVLDNGAGHLGNYSHTSFVAKGIGSFKPLEAANPYLGEINKLTRVNEYRLETIVPQNKIRRVIRAMLKAHPYEEVAYDLYPLENNNSILGIGRIGELQQQVKLADYLEHVKQVLGLDRLKFVGSRETSVKRVAICSGSGAEFIKQAARAGADLYITGDVKYHQAQLASELGIALIDAGHYGTETIVKDLLYNQLYQKITGKGLNLGVVKSEIDTNPWQYT